MFIFQSVSIWLIICFFLVQNIKSDFIGKRDDQDSNKPVQVLPFTTNGCGGENSDPNNLCLIPCKEDERCQNILWNFTIYPCACPAQLCSDGKVYSSEYNSKGTPLTDEELALQPHVKAPCYGCVPAQIAPKHQQIGDCSHLNCTKGGTEDDSSDYSGNDGGIPKC